MANLAEKIERYVEVGQTIHVDVIWRGQHYTLQMFFPGSTIPRKEDVQKQVQGVYPNAVVTRVVPATTDPTKPTIRVTKEGFISEEGLRDWFGKSKSKDGKKGWVNVVTGDSCASDKPGEGVPKCVSSAKRASMSKKERVAAQAAKRREDPGQQSKSGAAKPTMVKTDRKVKEDMDINEAKDKPGKGSGKKDACYHKVKSRYSVWPSAYASGALVKCRKKGAANWGNSTKKEELEGFYDLPELTEVQIAALKYAGYEVEVLDEKCWKGYEKKGMKTMFGKRYPNCVKKEENELDEKCWDGYTQKGLKKKGNRMVPNCVPVGEQNIEERSLSKAEEKDKEKYVKGMKKSAKDFKARYGDDYKSVMYATATNMAKEEVVDEAAAWTRKAGKNKSGGLNEKGRKSYERENPGSDLKAPSKKVGNPRRASFCARMKGMKKKLTSSKTANDPDSRINKSLRAWNC